MSEGQAGVLGGTATWWYQQSSRVVRMVGSVLGLEGDVVNLEPVGAGASIDDASVVPVEDGSAQGGAYLLGCASSDDAVFADGVGFGLAWAWTRSTVSGPTLGPARIEVPCSQPDCSASCLSATTISRGCRRLWPDRGPGGVEDASMSSRRMVWSVSPAWSACRSPSLPGGQVFHRALSSSAPTLGTKAPPRSSMT